MNMNYALFEVYPSGEYKKILDAIFASPYDAFNALREIGLSFQALGAETQTTGGETPMLQAKTKDGNISLMFKQIFQP